MLTLALLAISLVARVAAADTPPPAAPAPFDFKAYEAQREAARQAAATAQEQYAAAKAALVAVTGAGPLDPAQAGPELEQRNAYFQAALALVDASLQYELLSSQSLPLVLCPASLQGWLKEWPGNPYRGWAPLRVLPASATALSAGDLQWDCGPPAGYALVQGRVQPRSYTLRLAGSATAPDGRSGVFSVSHSAPAFNTNPPAGADLAQLAAQAQTEAWIRDRAQAWAARQPAEADPRQQAFMLRSMAEFLRSAHQVEQLKQALQAKPRAQWSEQEQTDYLQQALWLVYTGYNTYSWSGGKSSYSGGGSEAFWWGAGADVLPYWPDNPYTDWEPIYLEAYSTHFDGDSISPSGQPYPSGSLFLDTSDTYFDRVNADGTFSESYELYIRGAATSSAAPNLVLPDATKVWANRPPAGAVGCLELTITPQLSSEFNRALCHS